MAKTKTAVAPAPEPAAAAAPVAAPAAANEKSALSDGNMVRRKSDYLWMLVILGGMATAAQHFFPQRCVLEHDGALASLFSLQE